MKKIIILAIVALSTYGLIGLTGVKEIKSNIINYDSSNCRANDFPKQDISKQEEDDLKFMREEEKLACDFYVTMFDKWGLRPFENISRSEQKHMDAIKNMLDRYFIDDPVKNSDKGVFEDASLKSLYLALLEQGNKSDIEALKAAAEIEEVDIQDLRDAINSTDNEDLKFVYGNLLRASENHLRAFTRNLNKRGVDYQPKHLDKKYYQEIING